MSRPSSRRTFIRNTSAIGAAVFVGGSVNLQAQQRSANGKLNVASFGVGGKGGSDSSNAATFGNTIAICDVDKGTLESKGNSEGFKSAERFTDYREVLEKHGKNIDIATVSPDAKLSKEQIADLATWIRMKAPDPRLDDTVAVVKARSEIDWVKAREFWSLQPLSHPPPPAVQDSSWPANPIDNFVLARLESSKLTPAVDADKRTLIRRATFDLIGLPPSPEEVAAFLADSAPEAFATVVDRLLESPQYGERWGRHWMDVVRYADTAGDNSDFPIPQAYLYRNWVIEAFNRDLPYDEFVREQLAGDLQGGSTPEERRSRIIATGYIANARRFGSRVDDYPQHLTIEDTIDNVGRTFLAMTINCARCHNHKFDPITSDDYYALYGIFHSTRYPWPGIELDQRQRNFVALAPPEEVERVENERQARRKELDEDVKRLKQHRDKAQGDEQQTLAAALKTAEEAVREFSRQPLPYETIYAVAESPSIEDVAGPNQGRPRQAGRCCAEAVPEGSQRSAAP
jgi:hypothetical protein